MGEWPMISLGEILKFSNETAVLNPDQEYSEITIKLWGKGVVRRGKVSGSSVATQRRFVRTNQLVLSKIDARHGAIGVVPPELDGAIVTNDFPSFLVCESRIKPEFLGWLVRFSGFVELCRAASEGTTNRVRIKEDRFFRQKICLPPIDEQLAIVTRLNAMFKKIQQVEGHLDKIEDDADRLLQVCFQEAIADAEWRTMAEVAPLVRRDIKVDLEGSYPELGIRSFGKGTFHKTSLSGADVGSKRLFHIESGDLVFSNVFAWEGAIAVAKSEDKGRCGSHRFITCVPNQDITSSEFLRYYFLTSEGLDKIGKASPGGAGRNRTLGLDKLMSIRVPIPLKKKQDSFNNLQEKLTSIKAKHAETRRALQALIPSMLEKTFA